MSVVVFLVLYAIAINSLMKGILVPWSVSLVTHRGVVVVVFGDSLKFVNNDDLGVTRVVYIGV